MSFRFRNFKVYQDAKLLPKEKFIYFENRLELLSKQLGGFSKFLKS